ncbi:helix-turn-helix transcriptional regulator [Pseudoalteromonas sp. MMG012]|uniref:helix-turn-helix transcriptional regulator n=1 Tax=Pseudoalteromonas sp. MMG012 TaxID=2822686 RepID=UPI001B3A722E|nr:helix-turn-helix transcriptional regulator [Pseudoalteromonas sp. MMG012]MBQ4850728.1 helix-turn-helix transcriptional regulator [Pseudoalteromonas sp. MMG012]
MIDGDDLKAMRLRAGISQEAMAKKLECDRKTIINYELGVSDIRSKLLFMWFMYCKVDMGAFLSEIKKVRKQVNGTEGISLDDDES